MPELGVSAIDDATGDADGDGFDNLAEYAADTDPQDGDVFLHFRVEPALGSGEPTVIFATSANRTYTVQFHDDLGPTQWQDLGVAMAGSGGEMSVPAPGVLTQRFFRLKVEAP